MRRALTAWGLAGWAGLAGVAGLAMTGASCSPAGGPPACGVVGPTACPSPAPRYADVAAIVDQRCAGPCHSGVLADGPWPLTDYDHVADWADVIRGELLGCSMPPADSDVMMTLEERLAVLTWIRCGSPE